MTPQIVRRALIALGVAAAVAAIAYFFSRIPHTVAIFTIAAFIAFGAAPLVRRLEARLARPFAIGIVYSLLMGLLVVIALLIVPATYAQFSALLVHAPDYVSASQDVVATTERLIRARMGNRVPLPSFGDLQLQVGLRVASAMSIAFASIGTILLGTATALFVGTSALILSVFFVSRGATFGQSLLEFVPPARRLEVGALFSEIANIFGHFVAGQAFLCLIVGFAVWLVLLPVHFSVALLVAVICGLCYAVPFIGMIVAQIVAALLAIPQGTTVVVYVTVAIFVIARVADNVLVPKIMSNSVGVSPIGVMFAVFAGGELFGLPGLLLGIPAAALLKVLFKYFVQPYVVRMQLSGGPHLDIIAPDEVRVEVDVEVPKPSAGGAPPEVVVSVAP